jgi:hypothetical protein
MAAKPAAANAVAPFVFVAEGAEEPDEPDDCPEVLDAVPVG